MKKSKVTYLTDKNSKKIADENYIKEIDKYAQNPIISKFIAFRKTKKETNSKDLL